MASRRRHPTDRKELARVLEAPVGAAVRLRPGAAGRISVIVGGKSVGRMGADAAEALGLRGGARWTPELAVRIAKAVEKDQAARAAERLLKVRARSKRELTARLRRRGIDALHAEKVVARLEREGKVDDELFASLVAKSLLRKRPAGEALLRSRLRARGVDGETAARAAKDSLRGRDALADAHSLAKAKLQSMPPGLDVRARARRVMRALARRGFDEEVAMRALRSLLPGIDGLD